MPNRGKVFGICAKLRTINFPPSIIVPSVVLSLAQIIPQAQTGVCEELSIKQRDPKASPSCQLGFQAQVRRLQFCTLGKGSVCHRRTPAPRE